MYFMLVDYCNMSCKHCGMNAKLGKGNTMSLETFRNALKYVGDNITLGGGEPTLHPLFWQFLGESIAVSDYVWLATNGSNTQMSIAIANLAKRGVIGAALSQDRFHDPIDKEVIEAFTKQPHANGDDYREIRNVENSLIKAGRCKKGEKGCICDDLVVMTDGRVRACGCLKAPILGNVYEGLDVPDDWEWGTCYKKQPKN